MWLDRGKKVLQDSVEALRVEIGKGARVVLEKAVDTGTNKIEEKDVWDLSPDSSLGKGLEGVTREQQKAANEEGRKEIGGLK